MSSQPEYTEVDLQMPEGAPVRVWRCGACGSMVATADREIHDVWHQQLDSAMGQTPA